MNRTVNRPKKKPVKLEDLSKEQIRQAILRKRECNTKAQKVVESLIEECVSEDYLLQCLPDINQAHFDDIIEERTIQHLCGYPICQNTISHKDMPKQKYRISFKTNKVYDITARKSFCSNSCYKSAMYVKQQLLTSPLWFREHEEIPHFHLLPLDSAASMGQEVDLGVIEKVHIQSVNQTAFTSIQEFASASLNDVDMSETIPQNDNSTANKSNKTYQDTDMHQNEIAPSEHKNITSDNKQILVEKVTEKATHREHKKPPPNPTNIVGEIIEKPEKKIDPILTQPNVTPKDSKPKKVPQTKQPSVTGLVVEIEKFLGQWFTLDTIIFLFGEEKVREIVSDKGESILDSIKNYSKPINHNFNEQYLQLCKKLNILELEDMRSDAKILQRQMRPLPDYSILQEESKRMQLKVQAFMSGEMEIPEPEKCVQDTPTEDDIVMLPLVDKNSQNALRRRIVFQHLNKVLPDLLQSLGLMSMSIGSDVRLLVNTFKLQANNIMFKPVQWTLIALIFIKLLAIRDKNLKILLGQTMVHNHMQLLLLSYKLDDNYLNKMISWLTDIFRLLNTNDT